MIGNVEAAKYVSGVLLGINERLIESLDTVKASESAEDFAIYRKAVGRLINSIFESILEPIYQKHPMLKPQELE